MQVGAKREEAVRVVERAATARCTQREARRRRGDCMAVGGGRRISRENCVVETVIATKLEGVTSGQI